MMHCDPDHIGGAYSLLSAQAVRDRAHRLLALGLRDELPHFLVNLGRLDATAAAVLAKMHKHYPTGEIPIHSRWRHFMVDGRDRWAAMTMMWSAHSRRIDPISRSAKPLSKAVNYTHTA